MSLGHQVAAPLPAAVWSESLIGALNQSTAIWEMSPTATVIETQLVRAFTSLIGWGSEAGGTFTSGGTEATFTALLAARARAMPDAWQEGVGANPPVVLCGEHSHYSVTRAVAELGLGMRSVVVVPSREWRMDILALRDLLRFTRGARNAGDGRRRVRWHRRPRARSTISRPSARSARSAGSGCTWTVRTAPRRSCRRRTGTVCAGCITRDRCVGPAQDDAHAARGRHVTGARRALSSTQAFAQHAPYLFHGAAGERAWDQGTRSFQCSRRADVIKLWVGIQRYGIDGLAAIYDRLCDTARSLHAMLETRPDFEAMHVPETNILCFRWIGDGSRDDAALDAINLELRDALQSRRATAGSRPPYSTGAACCA